MDGVDSAPNLTNVVSSESAVDRWGTDQVDIMVSSQVKDEVGGDTLNIDDTVMSRTTLPAWSSITINPQATTASVRCMSESLA